MARVKVKFDDSGNTCLTTIDSIEDHIAMALESNFYVDFERTTKVWTKIVSIDNDLIKYSGTVMKYGQPSFKIMGTAKITNKLYYDGEVLGRKEKAVKLNIYLVVDWELA